jgi:predicted RNA polymerase sigma factor
VLAVIYLPFSEGYLASAGRTPAGRDMAAQAVALNQLLYRLMPRQTLGHGHRRGVDV